MVSKGLAAVAAGAALVGSIACSDDGEGATGPTVAGVTGEYVATRLTATSPLGTQDVLQAGGSLRMEFSSIRAFMGHLAIPGEGIDEEFMGTWRIDAGKVHISQVTGDVFIGDMEFAVVGNTLVGDRTFNDVRVQVTLAKQ